MLPVSKDELTTIKIGVGVPVAKNKVYPGGNRLRMLSSSHHNCGMIMEVQCSP